jgi:hypothetical protein
MTDKQLQEYELEINDKTYTVHASDDSGAARRGMQIQALANTYPGFQYAESLAADGDIRISQKFGTVTPEQHYLLMESFIKTTAEMLNNPAMPSHAEYSISDMDAYSLQLVEECCATHNLKLTETTVPGEYKITLKDKS